ncbi:RAF-like serine/threonine-protein kinase PRAF [Bidens hawaiensis]
MTRVTDSVNKPSTTTIKFLYSYNGKILPRHTDATLRYIGGHTRVLSVNRSISYSELIIKFYEACGFSVTVKCKLPSEDLDVLVSVSSDEELADVIEEYERVSPDAKIRVVLCPVSSVKSVSPVPSVESLVEYSADSKRVACPGRQWRRECSRFGCNVEGVNKKRL